LVFGDFSPSKGRREKNAEPKLQLQLKGKEKGGGMRDGGGGSGGGGGNSSSSTHIDSDRSSIMVQGHKLTIEDKGGDGRETLHAQKFGFFSRANAHLQFSSTNSPPSISANVVLARVKAG